MLKVNLLKGKDVPFAEEKTEIKESEFLSAEYFISEKENFETAEQEPVEKTDQPLAEEDHTESIPKEPKQAVTEEESIKEPTVEEEFVFQKRSKFPIVSVVVLFAIVLIVLAYFKFISIKKSGPVPVKVAVEDTTKKTAQPAAKEVAPTKKATHQVAKEKTVPVESPPSAMPSIETRAAGLSDEKKAGFAAANLFGKVLEALPSGAKIAFLSFNSGYFTIELYALKKETSNTFLQKAKASVPSFGYKIVSSDQGLYNGKKMHHTIVSGQIALSGGTVASGSVLGSEKAKAALLGLAKTDRVRVREIRKSPLVTDEKGKHIPMTIKISASAENIQKFLTDLLNHYRNVGVSRILMSASRSGGENQQDAALDLNLFLE